MCIRDRGHGDSEWAGEGNYSADKMVEDLVRVSNALGSDNPILVGASMGGGTSLIAVGEKNLKAKVSKVYMVI